MYKGRGRQLPAITSHTTCQEKLTETLSEYFLTWVIAYGAPVFAGILFASGLGLPLPASVLVIAVGAFVRLGMIDATPVFLYGIVAVVIGDSFCYVIGRWLGEKLPAKVKTSQTWRSAQEAFDRHAGLAVLLTRSVLSSLAVPINLIAGSSNYRYRAFLLFDLVGEGIWLGLYGGLGYIFGSQWESIKDSLSDFGGLLAGVVLLCLGGTYAIRWLKGSRPKESAGQPGELNFTSTLSDHLLEK
jgi:membrane-associated protein